MRVGLLALSIGLSVSDSFADPNADVRFVEPRLVASVGKI